MLSNLKNPQLIEILKTCLNKKIEDIYVTGWTEIRENYSYFSTMDWWYYIQFQDLLLCISSDTTKGMMQFDIQKEIKCNFEIENDDKFTIMRVNNINQKHYDGWKIYGLELFFGNYFPQEPAALGFECKDFNGGFETDRYIFFDVMTLDGIEVGDEKNRDKFLEDKRHYSEKIIE